MITLKNSLPEYLENEFINLVREIVEVEGNEAYQDDLLENFISVSGHPAGSDLIYYPEPGADTSAEGITETVKKWREANGLPGFKPRF